MIYEKIENIHPDKHAILRADLEQKTGLAIHRVKIGTVDFTRNKVNVTIYFYSLK